MYPSISHGQERYTSGNKLDGVCLSKMDEIYIMPCKTVTKLGGQCGKTHVLETPMCRVFFIILIHVIACHSMTRCRIHLSSPC